MNTIKKELIDFAQRIGIDKIGFAKVEPLEQEREISVNSYKKGYFANKDYLYRNLNEKSNPKLLLENANTVITIAINYNTPFKHSKNQIGKISRHAWGSDYHHIVKSKAREIANLLNSKYNADTFVSVDGGKVFEKIWAERCAIGWQGKNSLVISPEFGSWIFLGIIITSIEIEPNIPYNNLCGSCRNCIQSCPNNAIVKDKILDIRKCVSFLNIEDKKSEYLSLTKNLSGYIYGCDICQNVCPYNKDKPFTIISDFSPINGDINLSASYIEDMDKTQFNNRFNNTTIKRIGLEKLKANAKFSQIF